MAKITGGKIALFTLAAVGAAAGFYFSSKKNRVNAMNTISKWNNYLQLTDKVAFVGEKLGIVNTKAQNVLHSTAKTANKTMNKVLN
jgi:hypothetical protein